MICYAGRKSVVVDNKPCSFTNNFYFAIDNFPAELFSHLIDHYLHPPKSRPSEKMALVMDAREGEFIRHFEEYFELLRENLFKIVTHDSIACAHAVNFGAVKAVQFYGEAELHRNSNAVESFPRALPTILRA